MSIFRTDLNAAMAFKGNNPETTIFVSLENSHTDHDAFWSSPRVASAISIQTIVVRLTESENPSDFAQFRQLFKIDSVPSLTVFGPSTARITKQWDSYPSVDDFMAFVQPPAPRVSQRSENALPARSQTIKISVRARSGTISEEFARSATIGDLKGWLARELGAEYRVVVSPSQRPLPENDGLSLVEADLAPSAVLHVLAGDVVDGEVVIDRPAPRPREVVAQAPRERWCTEGTLGKVRKFAELALSLFNPWAVDDENEQFLQYKPNPQLVRDIRLQARMIRRMQRRQGRTE
jgi:hypothetical protein